MDEKQLAKAVAGKLLQIKAIKLSPQTPFTWASGLRSPIYCDNRLALSYPDIRNFIIEGFVDISKHFKGVEAIAGVASAGIPHGALLADRLALPFAYVREKAKAHGRQNQIEGSLPEGSRVLVVEDLISTGGSSLKAVEALREAGHEVAGVVAIFSYGFLSSIETFKAADCILHTLSNYDALIEAAVETSYLKPESLETLRQWRQNPTAWSEKWTAGN